MMTSAMHSAAASLWPSERRTPIRLDLKLETGTGTGTGTIVRIYRVVVELVKIEEGSAVLGLINLWLKMW